MYEKMDGHWIKEPINDDNRIIIEITDITPKSVSAVINGKEIGTKYDAVRNVSSNITVYDGMNYKYKISFHDYAEE